MVVTILLSVIALVIVGYAARDLHGRYVRSRANRNWSVIIPR